MVGVTYGQAYYHQCANQARARVVALGALEMLINAVLTQAVEEKCREMRTNERLSRAFLAAAEKFEQERKAKREFVPGYGCNVCGNFVDHHTVKQMEACGYFGNVPSDQSRFDVTRKGRRYFEWCEQQAESQREAA